MNLRDITVFGSDLTIESVNKQLSTIFLPDNFWSNTKKSLFLESLLIGIPTSIVVRQNKHKYLFPIDGHKRLSTIVSFFNNEFCLEGLEFLSELEGKNYDAIVDGDDIYWAKALVCATVHITFIRDCPEKLVNSIYDRLNS